MTSLVPSFFSPLETRRRSPVDPPLAPAFFSHASVFPAPALVLAMEAPRSLLRGRSVNLMAERLDFPRPCFSVHRVCCHVNIAIRYLYSSNPSLFPPRIDRREQAHILEALAWDESVAEGVAWPPGWARG